jgi:hypothetical protein
MGRHIGIAPDFNQHIPITVFTVVLIFMVLALRFPMAVTAFIHSTIIHEVQTLGVIAVGARGGALSP